MLIHTVCTFNTLLPLSSRVLGLSLMFSLCLDWFSSHFQKKNAILETGYAKGPYA